MTIGDASAKQNPASLKPIAACPSGSEARHEEAPTCLRDQLPQAARQRLAPRPAPQDLRGASRPLPHHPPQRPAVRPRGRAGGAALWLAQPSRPRVLRCRAILEPQRSPRRRTFMTELKIVKDPEEFD